MLFETSHPFHPSADVVCVGDDAYTVVKAASEKARRLVVEAPAIVGIAYGWVRRSDLESDGESAKPKAAGKSK